MNMNNLPFLYNAVIPRLVNELVVLVIFIGTDVKDCLSSHTHVMFQYDNIYFIMPQEPESVMCYLKTEPSSAHFWFSFPYLQARFTE